MGCSHLTKRTRIFARKTTLYLHCENVVNKTIDQKMIIVLELMYAPIIFCAKLSLFLLYHRLFGRHFWIRYLVYLGIFCSVAMYATGIIVYGYLCLPRSGQSWVKAVLSSRCHQQFIMVGYVRGSFNILSDLYLLLLPLPAVWQLHLPVRKRLGIAIVFLTGSL